MSMEAPACQNGDDSLGNDDLVMMMTGAYDDASADCDRVLHLVSSSDHCNLSFSFRYFTLTFILLLSLYRNTSIERSLQRLNHLVSDFTICNVDIFNKLSEFISNFPITVIIDRLWHSLSHRGGGPTAGSRRLTARSRGCDKAVFPPSCIQPLPRRQRQHILSHLVSDLFFAIC